MATKPYGEENLKKLRQIVARRQHSQLSFPEGKRARVDVQTASVLLAIHRALNATNKAKFVRMLGTFGGFKRLVDFAWTKAK